MPARSPRLAVQLYSFNAHCQTPQDCAATLKTLARQGWRNVQISGAIDKRPPQEVKDLCDAAGLTIIGRHAGLGVLREQATRLDLVAALKLWGCRHVAVPWLGPEERKDAADWKARARELAALGRALAKDGIVLQYHNHAFELERFGGTRGIGGRTALEILFSTASPTYLQAELDTCWIARGGGSPVAWILDMKGRMDQVHFKDTVVMPDGSHVFAPIGEGNLDWPGILAACRKAGVRDYIVEQDNPGLQKDAFEAFAVSLKNLKKMTCAD